MKKVENYSERFKDFKLYLSDIEEILNIIKSDNGKETEITINDYKLDNLDEIEDSRFNKIDSLKLQSYSPYISFDYIVKEIRLYRSDDSVEAKARFITIKDIIKNSRGKAYWAFRYIFKGIWFLIPAFWGMLFVKLNFNLLVLMGFFLSMSLLFLMSFLNSFFGRGVILNYTKAAKDNFFNRNKDSIILSIVFMIIGAIVGISIQNLVEFIV